MSCSPKHHLLAEAPKMEEPLDASTSASTALDTDCGASGGGDQ